MDAPTQEAMDSRARRAAKKVGLVARKSHKVGFNKGGFMLLNPDGTDLIVAGKDFSLTPEDVIHLCAQRTKAQTFADPGGKLPMTASRSDRWREHRAAVKAARKRKYMRSEGAT